MLRCLSLVICLTAALLFSATSAYCSAAQNWPNWQKYWGTVSSPVGAIKSGDIERARENLKRYTWAQDYLKSLQQQTDSWLPRIDAAYLERMIAETTPGSSGFTPCPACRDSKKPFLPHGNWKWEAQNPDVITCNACATVFPNEKYPENVTLQTRWGKPQTLTFMGGEPFQLFTYKGVTRPSLAGTIRNRKAEWMAGLASRLGQVYALSGEEKYAVAARAILLRFAQVYPNWLLHTGYGEYMDMDPRIAAANIEKLPQDELVVPPNKPDRAIHTNFWVAGRVGGNGSESLFVIPLVTAYDLTRNARSAGKELYSDSDRLAIERDLLLESTHHMIADKKINNKSVGNRSAVAMVGMVVGEPELVRFGIEGFDLTVNDWFLPDGSTPESPAYALMTLGRILDFVQALRGYTDPPGYRDAKGKRFDNYDPYRDSNYGKVWEAMVKTLQGDLRYPPFADSYTTSALSVRHAETLAAAFSEKPEYLALLKAVLKGDWNNIEPAVAIYLAEPGRENRQVPPLKLVDNVLPELRIGFMRSGEDGRESLLTLSASHWGGHHHRDSLNLYYWKQGYELLSDLGYLWDHPDRGNTSRTFAHNTVLIDETEQVTAARGGEVKYFLTTPQVKAMRAASTAYAQALTYERAGTLIDHGNGRNYVVDVFWARGGKTQDFVYHGPNTKFKADVPVATSSQKLYDLKNLRQLTQNEKPVWCAVWDISPQMEFTAWNLPQSDETTFVGDGWGQRDHRNTDRGATLPYVVRRTEKAETSAFVSLFEGHVPGNAFVQNVQRLTVPGANAEVVALQIETAHSRDYVVVSALPQNLEISTPDGVLKMSGTFAAVSVQNGKVAFSSSDQTVSLQSIQ